MSEISCIKFVSCSFSFGFKSVWSRLIFKFGGLLPMSPVSCTLQMSTSLTPENLPILIFVHYYAGITRIHYEDSDLCVLDFGQNFPC